MSIVLLACAPKNVLVEKPETRQALTQELQAPAKEAWEAEWDRTLATAKKEGKVVIYSGVGPETRLNVTKGFRERYGIESEFVAGTGAENVNKILT